MIESVFYLGIVGICAVFSFKAGRNFNSKKIIKETLDQLIVKGYLKYDEKNDQLIRYDK
jgi:hypothetical protein